MKIKIYLSLMVVTAVIVGLFFIGIYGFDLLSGVRAYVGGEGLWAKGQKNSTYHLLHYAYLKDIKRYQAFRDSLKIPLGDRVARTELEKADPDLATVVEGFRKGGNHPDDIPEMIKIFQKFRHMEEIDQAISQWQTGDQLIQQLLNTGERLHQFIESGNTDQAELNRLLTTINSLQKQLNQVEIGFSFHMSNAARQTADLLFNVMMIFSLIGGMICVLIFVYVGQILIRLKNYNEKLRKAAQEIKKLRGILPICSYCKKIRDDQGYWEQVDVYIRKHSDASISHGICPECAKKHFPELNLFEEE